GGAEIVAATMAEGLQQHLQRVFVVTTRPFQSFRSLSTEQVSLGDVSVYRFYPFNLYHYLQGERFPYLVRLLWHAIDLANLHSYFSVKRILQRERPDVVITHNLTGIGFLIVLLLRRLRVKHVHIVHDVQLYDPSGIILNRTGKTFAQRLLAALGYHSLMRFLFNSVSIVISPSQFLLDFYRTKGFFVHTPTEVIPNPVTLSAVIPHRESDVLRLLYIGRVSREKGIVQLLEKLRTRPELPIQMRVVGTGPELSDLIAKTSADRRFSLYGWLTRTSIVKILSDTDVLVVPSLLYDNFPTVVGEALSCGVPAVVSNIGGAKEIVRNGHNGWVFPAGDWDALLDRIEHLIARPQEVRRAARNARPSVENLSVAHYVQRLLTALQT
ncbi:MAG: glycosyltransferase, partial [Parcubacteria group bacterium]|nr:glycosyltransferase [Parcubacteria group bacterium]